MIAETIFVGTELLLGNIVNTNGAYLADRLAALGISTYYQTVVGDNLERISETVKLSLSRSDILILSGGLGPTQDDITRDGVAKALGLNLVTDEHSKKRIEEYFARSGKTMTENNYRQALVPEGGKAIDNECGTAPGIVIEKDGKTVILLPGPPVELKAMFDNENDLAVAIGSAWTIDSSGLSEVMRAADKAMYEDKANYYRKNNRRKSRE